MISKRTLRHCSAGKAAAMLCAGTSGSTFLPDTCPRLQSRYLSETIPSQRLLHDKVQSFLGCWCEPVPVHKANCCFMVGLSQAWGFGTAQCWGPSRALLCLTVLRGCDQGPFLCILQSSKSHLFLLAELCWLAALTNPRGVVCWAFLP